MVRVKEEVVLGSLLFLSSFFPYFYLSLPLIYALGIYLRLKYFPAFVSAILLLFSPLHSAIILIAYVLFFIDRRFSISFLLTTFFSILTENYLTLLLGFAIDRRGLIASGIFFLILAGVTFNTTYGNLAFFLFVAGVISTLIENKVKIDAKTSAIVYLSSLLVYFHLPYLIPILVSFSPLTSLLFSPFQPYLAIIALKKLGDFKKIKWGGKVFNLLPSLVSFLYPPLALSSISDVLRKREFVFYLIPFLISIVFFGLGDYSNFQLLAIISLVLLASRYINISKVISSIMILKNFYPYIISVVLEFLAFYFFYLNIPNFILLSIVAIAISFPIIFNPYPLFLSFLSLVNPYVGLSSMRWFSSIFLIIPLIAYLYFKFPIYPYVFYVVGVCLSIVGIRKLVNLNCPLS
ncbi:hypothetical protein V6M85_08470 [Sulfolobus tengchongensis]|uniref:Uncharacterized protein n=1 Tax=Sulfolobus tengchongensis TaxID=207809 RepID=A0AAX4KXB2_9CREN